MNITTLLVAGLMAGLAPAHPFHASTAEIAIGADGNVRVEVRVFSDDLATVAGATLERQRSYVAQRFELRDQTGARVPVTLDSTAQEGPATRFSGFARVGTGNRATRVWHGVLLERFADQVNVVRVRVGGQRRTLVFSAGDSAQALR